MEEWATIPERSVSNPVETGTGPGYTWTLYEGISSEVTDIPGELLISTARNVAVWDDRLLAVNLTGREPFDLLVPVDTSFKEQIVIKFPIPAIKRAGNAPPDAMYIKLSLGAMLYESVAGTGSKARVRTETLLNNHSLAHLDEVLLAESLTPEQQWMAFSSAARYPGMSPELIATLVAVRYDELLEELLCQRATSYPYSTLVSPALYRVNGQIESVKSFNLTDQTWWYMRRLAGILLNASNFESEASASSDSLNEDGYTELEKDHVVGGCRDCPRTSRSVSVEVATGDSFRWDDYEFFTGDSQRAAAIMYANESSHGNRRVAFNLLASFRDYRLTSTDHRRPGDRLSRFLPDESRPPIIETDTGAAYLPVPKGFFKLVADTVRSVGPIRVPERLMAAGFDPGVSMDGEYVTTGAQLSQTQRDHGKDHRLVDFIDPADLNNLITYHSCRLELDERKRDWVNAQWGEVEDMRVVYRLFGPDGQRAFIEPGTRSHIRTALLWSGFCQKLFAAVKDYFESYDEATSLPLLWHLQLVGFETTKSI